MKNILQQRKTLITGEYLFLMVQHSHYQQKFGKTLIEEGKPRNNMDKLRRGRKHMV
jgi:hypothetical protein